MAIFQISVLNNYLAVQDQNQIDDAYEKYTAYFHNKAIQENIRASKEEQFQEGFLRELFVKVLGYTLNPEPDFNLTTELKNEKDAKKCDGAILKDGSVRAVIELKGADKLDLDKVNDQAFSYKNNQTGCVYVIISNFEKLRFFIHNAVDHIEFDLFNLNKEKFSLLWLCLSHKNLLNGIPERIKKESVVAEKSITNQLYKDYATFKNDLWRNIVNNNKIENKLFLYKKSQKLLDRFLFILFCEDRGLLPSNTISKEIARWKKLKELDSYRPLYEVFKQYFGYIDKGKKGKTDSDDIYAYNGGLFSTDKVLENLIIDDSILLNHLHTLTKYDFNTEIDVNILGHIFENSLTQFEDVRATLEGIELDVQNTKRKKDGVFYTPKYITKYMVDSSLGFICKAKKNELGILEEEYTKNKKGRKKKTLLKLKNNLDCYRDWLLQLKICDLACGSGAFLNQVLDSLINEHDYIDELESKLFGFGFIFKDVATHILENNIYGVDINDESVEIAKLSLWLHTAEKGRRLTTLSNNIKSGNSLISESSALCDNPFDWEAEFPDVFHTGGFDIIIGNPPYVGEKGNSKIFEAIKQFSKWKEYYRRRSNTYYFFIKQGVDILKSGGIQSLIVPREFTTADWSNKVRKEITTSTKIHEIVDFNNISIFEDAGTTSLIITQIKDSASIKNDYSFSLKSISDSETIESLLYDDSTSLNIKSSDLDLSGELPWNFYQDKVKNSEAIVTLGTLFKVSQGLVTGADKVTNKHISNNLVKEKYRGRGIFILEEEKDIKHIGNSISLNIDDQWVALQSNEIDYIKRFVKTENLEKWEVTDSNYYAIYVGSNNLEGNVRDYLMQFSGILINRSTTIEHGQIISLADFNNFSLEDIKQYYSPAGAVQKIMRRKKWWLPLYERADIPFELPNIIVNTKNMDKFSFSDKEQLSSGGGAGGQNFIYLRQDSIYYSAIIKRSNIRDFVAFTTATLNSSFLQNHIAKGKYNQLSTAKISELPIIKINFENKDEFNIYKNIVNTFHSNSSLHKLLKESKNKFIQLISHIEGVNRLSNKITEWHTLDFSAFIKELNTILKMEKNELLSKKQELEWLELFNEQKNKVLVIEGDININENSINNQIFNFYRS